MRPRKRHTVPFAPSSPDVVRSMLKLAETGPDDVVYDLGSGDGRILLSAVREFGAKKAVGVEIDRGLAEFSSEVVRRRGLNGRVAVINDDLFRVDLFDADVVTLYLSGWMNELLRPKLEAELRPGTRVVSHQFRVSGWEPVEVKRVDRRRIYLYVIR